jgi:pyridoxamine 5'-phosphate oxidase
MNKSEMLAFFRDNPRCHLATVEDGSPRVRAVRIYKVEDNGILIQTFKSKDLYAQMISHPEIELCFNNYEAGLQVRVRGSVQPVEDASAIRQAMEDRPFLKESVAKGQEIAIFRLEQCLAYTWTKDVDYVPKTFTKLY